MADRTSLQFIKSIVLKCFPWLARIGLAPSGALQIKSAISRVEIEGPGPAAARVDDHADCGTLTFAQQPGGPPSPGIAITYTPPVGTPTIVLLNDTTLTIGGSPPVVVSLVAKITTGSEKVKIG